MKHYIDAEEKILGRLAVEIAQLLRGKSKPDFAPHKDGGDFVVVKNFDKIKVSGKKMKDKIYYRHSGYLGGLKSESFEEAFAKDPEKILKRAVFGMLPDNKLRDLQIKRLKIEK